MGELAAGRGSQQPLSASAAHKRAFPDLACCNCKCVACIHAHSAAEPLSFGWPLACLRLACRGTNGVRHAEQLFPGECPETCDRHDNSACGLPFLPTGVCMWSSGALAAVTRPAFGTSRVAVLCACMPCHPCVITSQRTGGLANQLTNTTPHRCPPPPPEQFTLDTTGYQNLVLTYYDRRSNAGAAQFAVTGSSNGGSTFETLLAPYSIATTFGTQRVRNRQLNACRPAYCMLKGCLRSINSIVPHLSCAAPLSPSLPSMSPPSSLCLSLPTPSPLPPVFLSPSDTLSVCVSLCLSLFILSQHRMQVVSLPASYDNKGSVVVRIVQAGLATATGGVAGIDYVVLTGDRTVSDAAP